MFLKAKVGLATGMSASASEARVASDASRFRKRDYHFASLETDVARLSDLGLHVQRSVLNKILGPIRQQSCITLQVDGCFTCLTRPGTTLDLPLTARKSSPLCQIVRRQDNPAVVSSPKTRRFPTPVCIDIPHAGTLYVPSLG